MPLDIGIVLDSSASIKLANFEKTKTFLKNFLQQFHIGSGPNDVRVALDLYGKGVYEDVSSNFQISVFYILLLSMKVYTRFISGYFQLCIGNFGRSS